MTELTVAEILSVLFQKYGAAGVSIGLCIYYVRSLENKIDALLNLNNKTFGVMLALVEDQNKRKKLDSKGPGENSQ